MAEDQLGSLPPPPGGRSNQSKRPSSRPSTRVAFSETSAPVSHRGTRSMNQSIPDLDEEPTKFFRPKAYACCAWGCMIIIIFFLLALIFSFIFLSIFHSYLPEIKVRRFNATRLDFSTRKDQATVKGRVDLLVQFENKNEKTSLKFGAFKLSGTSSHVDLGKTEIKGFTQNSTSSKSFNATIGVNQNGVDKDDAEQLKADIKNQEVVLELSMVGSVSFPIAGINMNEIPIVAACECKQREVDFGVNAKCDYRIFKS